MTNHINQLPNELVWEIAENMNLRDLIQISHTSINDEVYRTVLQRKINTLFDEMVNTITQSEGTFLPIMILQHASDVVKLEYSDMATKTLVRLLSDNGVLGLFAKEMNAKYGKELNKFKQDDVAEILDKYKNMEPFFDPYICEWDRFTSFIVIRDDYDKESIRILREAIQKYPKCVETLVDDFNACIQASAFNM